MLSFKPSEVAQIGMGIEKNGMAFYNALADRVKDGEAKSIFSYLANQEETHYETFEKLSTKFSSYEIPEGFGEEDENYLQRLVDNNVRIDSKYLRQLSQMLPQRDILRGGFF